MGLPPPPADRLFAVMHDGSNPLTWGEMAIKRNRIAHSLAARLPANILAGAVYAKNCPEWLLSNQALGALGLRFSPINWHLVADEIAYIVDDCDADVVFFGAEFAQQVKAMKPQTPKVKLWVCMDGQVEGAVSLQQLIEEAPVDAQPPAHSRKGGAVGYTGGTSGKPKGAVRSAAPGGGNPKAMMAMLKEWGFIRMMPTPVQLVCAPLYHAMPSAWYMFGVPLGTTFVLMPKFDATAALAAIEKFKVNGFYMPPILLKRLLQAPSDVKSQYDRSTVKTVMSGGAACPSSVKQGMFDMFGPVLFEIYGASELGGVAIMDPDNMLKKPLSCGKLATGIEAILLDEHRNRIDKPGVAGEIYAKGSNVDGYHKQEAKTQEAKYGDFFSVGDVGYFDDDGFLYISDRKIDMVVSGGVNIYPAQVEEILQGHPDIEDVAVFGIPDEEYGERVHAALKPFEGRRVTAEAILTWCEGKIGKFQLPKARDVTFHSEDFPRSEAGKLRKKNLKAQILSRPTSKL